MSFPLLIAILALIFFGILTISSSIREDKLKKRLQKHEEEQTYRELEETLLAEVYDSIDHAPDFKKIAAIITEHIRTIIPCSTVSSLIVGHDKLSFAITAMQPVSHAYIDELKASMRRSAEVHEKHLSSDPVITEHILGQITEDNQNAHIADQFHVPLMIHNSVAAIITITLAESGELPQAALASLQRIVKHTGKAISKIDAALEVEKGRMTAMIESLSDGLLMIDTEHNLQFINPAAKRLLHLNRPHLTTMEVLSALPISHDFVGKITAALTDNVTSELESIALKNTFVSFTITPVRASTGVILGASVIMQDDTLKHSVPRMKEDFTNILIHHLRSPLTSIKASSQLLNMRTDFSTDEQRKLIHLIYQQSDKLLTEVQEILDAAKLEAGVFILHKRAGDLKKLLSSVIQNFTQEAEHKMINFTLDVDPRLPNFTFDTEQIGHALTNVLSNSFKFTSSGGRIQITARQNQDKAVITITDTGVGIPKDKQHLLFHKFSQITEASAQIGTGLGLYVVKGVVEAHDGTVTLDSDTGRGTTITIKLPITQPAHLHESLKAAASNPQRIIN